MRKMTVVCDRCGKQYVPDFDEERQYTILGFADDAIDICDNCYKLFVMWMKRPADIRGIMNEARKEKIIDE